MKEQLLGRSAKPAPTAVAREPVLVEEEFKVLAHPKDAQENSGKQPSGQVEKGQAPHQQEGSAEASRDVLVDSIQTPPSMNEDAHVDTPRDLALEKQSLTEKSQNSGRAAN